MSQLASPLLSLGDVFSGTLVLGNMSSSDLEASIELIKKAQEMNKAPGQVTILANGVSFVLTYDPRDTQVIGRRST
jgi:hypothetical protein